MSPSGAHRRALAATAAAAALALGGCGGGDGSGESESAGGEAEGCEEVPPAQPKRVDLRAPKRRDQPARRITATVSTSCGSFDIALDAKRSPKTVNSFTYLVTEGVYDGTPVHRVVDDFLIQGGDPGADGTGDAGYTIVERPPPNTSYTQGVVAMVKRAVDPDGTSGSQFFVVTAVDAGLAPQYALLGKVSKGFSTVERIEGLAVPELGEAGGEPEIPVVIDEITLNR